MADQPHDDRDRSEDLLRELQRIFELSGIRSTPAEVDGWTSAREVDLAGARYHFAARLVSD